MTEMKTDDLNFRLGACVSTEIDHTKRPVTRQAASSTATPSLTVTRTRDASRENHGPGCGRPSRKEAQATSAGAEWGNVPGGGRRPSIRPVRHHPARVVRLTDGRARRLPVLTLRPRLELQDDRGAGATWRPLLDRRHPAGTCARGDRADPRAKLAARSTIPAGGDRPDRRRLTRQPPPHHPPHPPGRSPGQALPRLAPPRTSGPRPFPL